MQTAGYIGSILNNSICQDGEHFLLEREDFAGIRLVIIPEANHNKKCTQCIKGRGPVLRIYLYILLATAFTAVAVAETHTIVIGGSTDTFEVAPGDTVIFEVGCVSLLWSGHPCSPDGVFFGGSFPPHCAPIEWGRAAVLLRPSCLSPVLAPTRECDILWSGLISVVGDGTVINVSARSHNHSKRYRLRIRR